MIRKISKPEIEHIQNSWVLDGDIVFWKRGRMIGKPVSISERPSGHQNIFLRYDGKLRGYVLSRIIWLLRHGVYPEILVEHKDCNPKNNSVENLRLSTQSQNMANTRTGRTGRIKKGVYLDIRTQKYYTQVQKDGRVYSKCGFVNFEDAYKARQELAIQLFGEFAR